MSPSNPKGNGLKPRRPSRSKLPAAARRSQHYDVIVMGGGPAGSTCATILAQEGLATLLLEKDKFPRHHIGESLIPDSYWTFRRTGFLDKLKASSFPRKFSVQFATPQGKESRPFYFFETNHHESAVTWQVTRADFDKLLLDHAREKGVRVREETPVREVLFEGECAIGVRAQIGPAEIRDFRAKVVVDATGLHALLANRLGIRVRDPQLKKGVIYSYFKDAQRDPGIDAGATLVLKTPQGNGWFWYIPLSKDVTSVGIVADPDYLFQGRGKDLQKIFDQEIARCKAAAMRLKTASQCDKIYTTSDFSYRSTRCAGPGYVLIGDAYGFLDPIYSSGVLIALRSAEFAADCILEAFKRQDFSGECLGAFGERLKNGVESMRKLVYAFYTEGFSFSKFLAKHPEYRANLIDLLVGDIFKPGVDDIYEPMGGFFEVPRPIGSAAAPERVQS